MPCAMAQRVASVTSSCIVPPHWCQPALSKSKPGTVNYASYGVGSMAQLNLEAFNQKMGTDMLHVPYKGASPAAQAAVSGEVGVTISTVPAVQGFACGLVLLRLDFVRLFLQIGHLDRFGGAAFFLEFLRLLQHLLKIRIA